MSGAFINVRTPDTSGVIVTMTDSPSPSDNAYIVRINLLWNLALLIGLEPYSGTGHGLSGNTRHCACLRLRSRVSQGAPTHSSLVPNLK